MWLVDASCNAIHWVGWKCLKSSNISHQIWWFSCEFSLEPDLFLQVFRLRIWRWGRVANVGRGMGHAWTHPNGLGFPSIRNTHSYTPYYPISYLQETVNNRACVKLGLGAKTWQTVELSWRVIKVFATLQQHFSCSLPVQLTYFQAICFRQQ